MSYRPRDVVMLDVAEWPVRAKQWDRLFRRLPRIEFYLGPMIEAYTAHSKDDAEAIIRRWEASAPNPDARRKVLACEDDAPGNLLLFGNDSGMGKTTVAFEAIWRQTVSPRGIVHIVNVIEREWPLEFTGCELSRQISEHARLNKLSDYVDPLLDAEILLLDDIDKRGNQDGKFSAIVQQTLLELIERRTCDPEVTTILTMNSAGTAFLNKFDQDIAPYIKRRLSSYKHGGRFRHVNFDRREATNVPQLEAAQ